MIKSTRDNTARFYVDLGSKHASAAQSLLDAPAAAALKAVDAALPETYSALIPSHPAHALPLTYLLADKLAKDNKPIPVAELVSYLPEGGLRERVSETLAALTAKYGATTDAASILMQTLGQHCAESVKNRTFAQNAGNGPAEDFQTMLKASLATHHSTLMKLK